MTPAKPPSLDELIEAQSVNGRFAEGSNAGWAWGLANCSRCSDKTNLTNDYIFVKDKPVCTECATFWEAIDLGKAQGHAACFAKLAPALKRVLVEMEYAYDACDVSDLGTAVNDIREILEGKST